jgi:hypothetical protein
MLIEKRLDPGQTHDLSIINQPVTSQAFFVPRLGNLALWHFFDTFVLDNCTVNSSSKCNFFWLQEKAVAGALYFHALTNRKKII